MVETTLIRKLANDDDVASGQYVEKFWPWNTLQNYSWTLISRTASLRQCRRRRDGNWDDCLRFRFLAVGGNRSGVAPFARWKRVMLWSLTSKGPAMWAWGAPVMAVPDAHLPTQGEGSAENDLRAEHRSTMLTRTPSANTSSASSGRSAVERAAAKCMPKSGLYMTTHIRASLDAQPTTTAFIEDAFGVDLAALADGAAT